MDLPREKPQEVRVKEYKNGWAVELLYGGQWKNLHALMEDFPDRYYFETPEQAERVAEKIKRMK